MLKGVTSEEGKNTVGKSLGEFLTKNGISSYEKASNLLQKSGINEELKEIALKAADIQKPAEDAATSLTSIGNTTGILSNVKNVLSGIWSLMKTHPAVSIISGISAVAVTAYAIYKKLQKTQDEYIKDGEKAQENINTATSNLSTSQNKLKGIATTYKKSTKEIKNQEDAVNSLTDSYTELYKGVNKNTNENRSLSDTDYQQYISLSNELAELNPELVSGYDEQGKTPFLTLVQMQKKRLKILDSFMMHKDFLLTLRLVKIFRLYMMA